MTLDMFRALQCSSSGGQLYICSFWYRHSLWAALQCTNWERTQSAFNRYTLWQLTHRPPLPPGMFLVLIFARGWVDPRATERSEGDMSLKNPVTPPGIDPRTVQLIAQHLNHYVTPGPIQVVQTFVLLLFLNVSLLYESVKGGMYRTLICPWFWT